MIASGFVIAIKKFLTRFVRISSILSLLSLLVVVQSAAADDGPWFNLAVGSCDAPQLTSEISAGDTVLVVGGGLMSSSPFEYIITARTTDVSQPYLNVDLTITADSSGQVCAEALATNSDDFGQFDVNVHGLRANQRSYNAFAILTIKPAPVPTATPEPTDTPTPEPTDTPTAESTTTPEPTATSTSEPTNTPEPTSTPDQTSTPAPKSSPIPDSPSKPAKNPGQSGLSNPVADPDTSLSVNLGTASSGNTATQNSPKVQSSATVNLLSNVNDRVAATSAPVIAQFNPGHQGVEVDQASPAGHANNRAPTKSGHNFIAKSESFIHPPAETPQEVTSILVSIIWIAALGMLVTTIGLLIDRSRY